MASCTGASTTSPRSRPLLPPFRRSPRNTALPVTALRCGGWLTTASWMGSTATEWFLGSRRWSRCQNLWTRLRLGRYRKRSLRLSRRFTLRLMVRTLRITSRERPLAIYRVCALHLTATPSDYRRRSRRPWQPKARDCTSVCNFMRVFLMRTWEQADWLALGHIYISEAGVSLSRIQICNRPICLRCVVTGVHMAHSRIRTQ